MAKNGGEGARKGEVTVAPATPIAGCVVMSEGERVYLLF